MCAEAHWTTVCIERMKGGQKPARKCVLCRGTGHSSPSYTCPARKTTWQPPSEATPIPAAKPAAETVRVQTTRGVNGVQAPRSQQETSKTTTEPEAAPTEQPWIQAKPKTKPTKGERATKQEIPLEQRPRRTDPPRPPPPGYNPGRSPEPVEIPMEQRKRRTDPPRPPPPGWKPPGQRHKPRRH